MRQKNHCLSLRTTLIYLGALICLGSVGATAAFAQPDASTLLRVNATAPIPPAAPADYQGGTGRAPNGSTLGVTNRYLTRDGKPWLPVMGEFHYTRVPEAQWEEEILKMKTAGVNIISTYVIWIHHEEVKGQWDWTGRRDLRHFAELCQKHGMLLYPRIGPWAHAETRNGGLPDWVVDAGPVRQLNPTFMAETGEFYHQVGAQLRGLMWKDGGPVIGVQIENEYAGRGPGKGEAYILALKKLAVESGFDVPLYTVTGWDNAVVPPGAVLPVYGGYPDAPWGASLTPLPPQEVYAFRFRDRVSGNMGMIGTSPGSKTPEVARDRQRTPFLTAEVGGGIEDTYHRRPVVSADDIAAMMPVMLGSGVNLYGSYMFQGGENPDGKLTTLQESQATHYPTDVPVKSYDFQAPLGEFGLERQSLREIKEWNYFLNDFGSLLAPMPAFAPAVLPKSPEDLSTVRFSVRTDGQHGFLFLNNYVRGADMPAHPHTQFAVELPGGTLTLPEKPIDLPSGAFFAWPFHLDLGGVPLRYATAQLVNRLDTGPDAGVGARLVARTAPTFVFACLAGIRCEVAFEAAARIQSELPPGLREETSGGLTVVIADPRALGQEPLRLRTSQGGRANFLLLSPAQAEDAWKVQIAGEDRLLSTSADVFADQVSGTVTLRSLGSPDFQFTLYPRMTTPPTASATLKTEGPGIYSATLPDQSAAAGAPDFQVEPIQTQPAGTVPPVALGPVFAWRKAGVAMAPPDGTWTSDAARWRLEVLPAALPPGVSNLFLSVHYAGDEARLVSHGKLLEDNFYNGEAWQVGLKRFLTNGQVPALELEILPMRGDAPVYLEPAARQTIQAAGQTVRLESVSVVPQYQLVLRGAGSPPARQDR